jgi:hypothetical protein
MKDCHRKAVIERSRKMSEISRTDGNNREIGGKEDKSKRKKAETKENQWVGRN